MSAREIVLSIDKKTLTLFQNGEVERSFDAQNSLADLIPFLKEVDSITIFNYLGLPNGLSTAYLALFGTSVAIRDQEMGDRLIQSPDEVEALARMEQSATIEDFIKIVIAISTSHQVGSLSLQVVNQLSQ